jgi:hypothetical protein
MNNNSFSSGKDHNIFKVGIEKYQVNKYREVEKYYLSETIKLSLITGPLYCISANMQFLSHSTITTSFPFKPNFFSSYKECLFNLRRQGLLGFYKGNFYRLLFFSCTNKVKKSLDPFFSNYVKNKRLKELVLYSTADILLNPLLFIEARYSIQNRRKGYAIYNNLLDVFRKSGREIYSGALYSIPRNCLFLLSLNFYFLYPHQYTQVVSVFFAHLLSYPILTIQRNKIFQSNLIDYLPKNNYGFIGFAKGLIKEFGFLSLYRGFLSYGLATVAWHLYVPFMAKAKFYNNALKDDQDALKLDFFEDDEYEEENNSDNNIITHRHTEYR